MTARIDFIEKQDLLDPYFPEPSLPGSGYGAGVRKRTQGVCFGTVDTWLICAGRHAACDRRDQRPRTLLYNIKTGEDDDILRTLNIPARFCPKCSTVPPSLGPRNDIQGGIAILGVAGDQQAATVGQACLRHAEEHLWHGCFALLNTGDAAVRSNNRLLTTIAYQIDGKPTYALEGAIFVAGAAVQWLRDGIKVVERADQTARMADAADPEQSIYLVPAFTGLGAPHWDPNARGALFGLTRATGPNELAHAALESVCYQTADLIDAMHADWPGDGAETVLRVDGGMVANDWMMQRLTDILAAPVDRPVVLETTALGAAWLAGSKAGVWPDQDGFAKQWRLDRRFEPAMGEDVRATKLAGWRDAVRRTLTSA